MKCFCYQKTLSVKHWVKMAYCEFGSENIDIDFSQVVNVTSGQFNEADLMHGTVMYSAILGLQLLKAVEEICQ